MKNKYLSRFVLSILMLFIFVPNIRIVAEGTDMSWFTVTESTDPIQLNKGAIDLEAALNYGYVRRINLNVTNDPVVERYDDETESFVNVTAQAKVEPGIQLVNNDAFRVTYPDAFNDNNGNLVTLVLEFSNIKISDSTDVENCKINRLIIEDVPDLGNKLTTIRTRITGFSGNDWPKTWDHTTSYDFKESYYSRPSDSLEPYNFEDLDPYNFTGLVGIYDIDNADYLFNTRNKILYYLESQGVDDGWLPITNRKAGDHMFIYPEGVKRDRTDYNSTDGFTGYKYAGLYIPLTEEQSFSLTINANGDFVHFPLLYNYNTAQYRVEYYYQEVDENGNPIYDVNGKAQYPVYDAEHPIPEKYYDVRTGISGTTAKLEEADYEPIETGYVLDDSATEKKYEGTILDDGTLVLKVFFNKPFTVIYNDGVEGEEIFPDQVYENIPYNGATPEFVNINPEDPEDDYLKRREGYDFNGWNPDPKAVEKVIKNGYYEAQWKPWEYTIKYLPGCNEGEYTGSMADHIYYYPDPTMNSDALGFRRDGYEFVGFSYTNPEKYTDIYQPGVDFKKELLKPENEKVITLTAIWKKIERREIKIPVTGIE